MVELIRGLRAEVIRGNLERVRSEIAATGRDPTGVQILAAVKYVPVDELDARLGEHGELLDRDVLHRREDLHVGEVAAGGGDLGPDPLEVRTDVVGPEAPDQLNHTNPA